MRGCLAKPCIRFWHQIVVSDAYLKYGPPRRENRALCLGRQNWLLAHCLVVKEPGHSRTPAAARGAHHQGGPEMVAPHLRVSKPAGAGISSAAAPEPLTPDSAAGLPRRGPPAPPVRPAGRPAPGCSAAPHALPGSRYPPGAMTNPLDLLMARGFVQDVSDADELRALFDAGPVTFCAV